MDPRSPPPTSPPGGAWTAIRLYAGVAAAFLALALAAVAAKRDFDFIVSDGRGYYVYLPSLVVDGDLDFRNQMEGHWGADSSPGLLARLTPTGLVANRYPIGMALTLLPSFLIAEVVAVAVSAVAPLPGFRPDGYSPPFQVAGLLSILALGLATMAMLHRWLVRRFGVSEGAARWAVLLFWVGSPYAYYYFREPFMVHVVSTFWVTVAVVLASDGERSGPSEPSPWRGPLCAFAVAMAVVCRPTNVFLLLLIPAVARGPLRRGGARYLIALVPPLAQVAVWKALWGSWIVFAYGGEGFRWGHPALVETLFSPLHGLLLWSPLLVLAGVGLAIGRRRLPRGMRGVVLALLGAFLVLWYLNSAWITWWFGDAFGGRAFLELAPLFVLGLALAAEWVRSAGPTARRFALAGAAACVAYSWILMALYIGHRIGRSDPLF